MFGESESESPRIPSPWDPFLSPSPSPSPAGPGKVTYSTDISSLPKLVPEHDEGNIEYKLHLLHPSPARFARLVTQLKWRLLEGGGQAFYELGVADEGALIGLTPPDLVTTLDTLRAMAAEIGAQVAVVKEIEVMGATVREEDAKEFSKKGRDKDKDKKFRTKVKTRNVYPVALAGEPASFNSVASSPAPSSYNSTISLTTDSDYDVPTLVTDYSSTPSPPTIALSTPSEADATSNVTIELDESLALFSMDPESESDGPAIDEPAITRLQTLRGITVAGIAQKLTIDLEAFSALDYTPGSATSTVTSSLSVTPAISSPLPLRSPPLTISPGLIPHEGITKTLKRRAARDLRRAQRRKALEDLPPANIIPSVTEAVAIPAVASTMAVDTAEEKLTEALDQLELVEKVDEPERVRRMIVEAMVVRQLDDDEAFLDFTRV